MRRALLCLLLAAAGARAVASPCEGMTEEQRKTADTVFAALHPYDECDGTFRQCLEEKPPKAAVVRLAADLCRRIRAGKDRAELERGLSRRAQSVLPLGRKAVFALDEAMRAGEPGAPVTIVCFACARCPYCKVIVPGLYEAVTKGALKGKACLYFKPFPIKDHPGSLEGGLAMVAAAQFGRFWPLTLDLYAKFDTYCPKALDIRAVEAGMDRAAFEAACSAKGTRGALVASKKEGLKHKVESTPTLFIDGRKYVYEVGMDAILDVVEEVHGNRISKR
jgi:protein-disulfide isomerase